MGQHVQGRDGLPSLQKLVHEGRVGAGCVDEAGRANGAHDAGVNRGVQGKEAQGRARFGVSEA